MHRDRIGQTVVGLQTLLEGDMKIARAALAPEQDK